MAIACNSCGNAISAEEIDYGRTSRLDLPTGNLYHCSGCTSIFGMPVDVAWKKATAFIEDTAVFDNELNEYVA